MKIFIYFAALLLSFPASAGNVRYGYNAQGEYVPMQVEGKDIRYGYNAKGEYVPMKVGNDAIQYGFSTNY